MKYCLPLLLILTTMHTSQAGKIKPKVVGPPHICRSTCCDLPGRWQREWAVFHPTKLAPASAPDSPLPETWVVKRSRFCCEHAQYDRFQVTGSNSTQYAGSFDRYRVRSDSPRIPPVLTAYWPDREVPDWFTAGDYFYFVRIDPADPDQQCLWWISAHGQEWQLLEAGSLVSDPQRRQALGGPPQLALPWGLESQ